MLSLIRLPRVAEPFLPIDGLLPNEEIATEFSKWSQLFIWYPDALAKGLPLPAQPSANPGDSAILIDQAAQTGATVFTEYVVHVGVVLLGQVWGEGYSFLLVMGAAPLLLRHEGMPRHFATLNNW